MLKNSLQPNERLQDNPLRSHLSAFAASLVEDGYADVTVQLKLGLLADFGLWFGRTKFTVTHIDERLIDAFVKQQKQVRRGDLKTLEQFLDYLRKREVVPPPKPICNRSPLAHILNRYERYLRSERGLVTITILHYLCFIRRFLVELFHEGPFLLQEVKPSDVSKFVLRHAHAMAVKRAQVMTTAFRSFFRYLFQ